MNQYFIHDGAAQRGPFTLQELKAKNLPGRTPIWYEGLVEWTTLGSLPEFSPNANSKSSPPPFTVASQSPTHTVGGDYATTMEEYFPEREKRSYKGAIIAGIGVFAMAMVFWLANANSENSQTIAVLKDQIVEQTQEIQQKERIEQQKADNAKKVADALEEKNREYRRNWDRYIKEQHSEPKTNFALGGISEFYVYVSNESEYTLDQVDVYIQYIRKSGEVWQDKLLSFFNLPAHSVENLVAPSSVNGVKIKVEIRKVICKKMQFCYPSLNSDRQDPYFCK